MEETVGQRLRRLRLARNLSQRDLAAQGVSYAYISRIEGGTRQPSVRALRRLAAKLGVTPEYLETGSDLDPAEQRELLVGNLELAVRLGETEGVEEQLVEVAQEAAVAGDAGAALRARVALAVLAQERGEYGSAVALLETALRNEPFQPVERFDVYTELGRAYAADGRPQQAVELFERCVAAVAEAGADPSLEARYATLLSYALGDLGELARAEKVVRRALELVEDSEDPYMRVRLYWSLARVAHGEGRAAEALANVRRAIALLEATDDTLHLARAHLLAAGITITRGLPDDAAAHLDRSELLLGAKPDFIDTVMVQVKRAQVAALRQDAATAVELARAAIATIGDRLPAELAAARIALADGLALEGRADEADEAYRQGVDLLEEHHRWREATQACRAWARLLRSSGREERALDVLDRAAVLGLRATPAEPQHVDR